MLRNEMPYSARGDGRVILNLPPALVSGAIAPRLMVVDDLILRSGLAVPDMARKLHRSAMAKQHHQERQVTKHLAAGIALGVVGTVAIVMAIWLGVVYTGSYNVAASEQHADVVRWTFDTTRHRSVAKQAGDVELPRDPSRDLVAKGAGHYAETCVHCHGAPGQDPEPWSRGMRPEPPDLAEAATEWTPAEIHWIVANGIKMTGMPAMGGHHSHEDIVALTAFVEALPGLTAEDYRGLTGSLSSNTGREPSARQRPEHSHAQGGDRSQLY